METMAESQLVWLGAGGSGGPDPPHAPQHAEQTTRETEQNDDEERIIVLFSTQNSHQNKSSLLDEVL